MSKNDFTADNSTTTRFTASNAAAATNAARAVEDGRKYDLIRDWLTNEAEPAIAKAARQGHTAVGIVFPTVKYRDDVCRILARNEDEECGNSGIKGYGFKVQVGRVNHLLVIVSWNKPNRDTSPYVDGRVTSSAATGMVKAYGDALAESILDEALSLVEVIERDIAACAEAGKTGCHFCYRNRVSSHLVAEVAAAILKFPEGAGVSSFTCVGCGNDVELVFDSTVGLSVTGYGFDVSWHRNSQSLYISWANAIK